jgi:hypothetical protein
MHSPRASPLGDEPTVGSCQGQGSTAFKPAGCLRGLGYGLLSVLDRLGDEGGGAFYTELEAILEVLLLLENDGCGHLMVPLFGGILDRYALST